MNQEKATKAKRPVSSSDMSFKMETIPLDESHSDVENYANVSSRENVKNMSRSFLLSHFV